MQIDRENGTLRFPDGVEIDPALTQDALRALPTGTNAQSWDCGTLPWIHYDLSGGQVDGKELLVSLCFYDQVLVRVSITTDLYPPGPKDWSNYSLDVQAATKRFHDLLLEKVLGPPSDGGSCHPLPTDQAILERPLGWRFPWGRVFSYHDSRGGGTRIDISYGDRLEEATKAYERRTVARLTKGGTSSWHKVSSCLRRWRDYLKWTRPSK
jgi:hypothetical protein